MYNPQAFPTLTKYDNINGVIRCEEGMDLRDYFAGQALIGSFYSDLSISILPETRAKSSYKIADAMLAERSK